MRKAREGRVFKLAGELHGSVSVSTHVRTLWRKGLLSPPRCRVKHPLDMPTN